MSHPYHSQSKASDLDRVRTQRPKAHGTPPDQASGILIDPPGSLQQTPVRLAAPRDLFELRKLLSRYI